MADRNIYQKLQDCRVELQAMNLKKSGKNEYSNYDYYELQDFLPQVNLLFQKNNLCGVVSFGSELAKLTIYNSEKPEEIIVLCSPMKEASLKACHPIQNLGAVESYQRRYLYMAALEIVEHDAIDPTTGKPDEKPESRQGQQISNKNASKPQSEAKVSKQMANDIWELAQEFGWNQDDVKAHIKEKYGIDSAKGLSQAQAEELIGYLKDLIEKSEGLIT